MATGKELRKILQGMRTVSRTPYPSSDGTPDKYTVIHYTDNTLSCNCRGWCTKKGDMPRDCWHVRDKAGRLRRDGITVVPFTH